MQNDRPDVPANAEIIIEGVVNPDDLVTEGPFGDHTGYYSAPQRYPRFEVKAITHGQNPIYPATVVGRPPMEDYYIGKATERLSCPWSRRSSLNWSITICRISAYFTISRLSVSISVIPCRHAR